MAVSAAQGLGTGDLLDAVVAALPDEGEVPEEEDDAVRLAVDRPPQRRQVDRSSTSSLGSERVIVSDVAGTTRDAIDLPLEVDGRKLVLVDTAGLRRQSKVAGDTSSTTRRCARAARPSAPTWRSSSATPPTASPRRTCGSPSWR